MALALDLTALSTHKKQPVFIEGTRHHVVGARDSRWPHIHITNLARTPLLNMRMWLSRHLTGGSLCPPLLPFRAGRLTRDLGQMTASTSQMCLLGVTWQSRHKRASGASSNSTKYFWSKKSHDLRRCLKIQDCSMMAAGSIHQHHNSNDLSPIKVWFALASIQKNRSHDWFKNANTCVR